MKVAVPTPPPPVDDVYHTGELATQVADNEAVVPEQMVVPDAVGAATAGLTVTITVTLELTQDGVPKVSQAT